MQILQTAEFTRAYKKLHQNQRADIDKAVKNVANNPIIGQQKKGDIAGIRVHKFKMVKQLTLLAYTYEDKILTLTLLMFGTHENFYRDLKRKL